MATLAEVQAQVTTLQTALDDKQAALATGIQGLQDQLSALRNQIANGPDPVALQAISDGLAAILTDLQSTQVP